MKPLLHHSSLQTAKQNILYWLNLERGEIPQNHSWQRRLNNLFLCILLPTLYATLILSLRSLLHLLRFYFFRRRITNSDRNADKERRLNANMIERRRMQNINSGFTSLKRLLPPTEKKQTKAAILQQAVQHILRLQRTVVQVRENNNALRQNLADERKQSLTLKKKLDVQIGDKFPTKEFQRGPLQFSNMHSKGRPPTPPHEDHADPAFNRWPALSCANDQAFDLFSLRETRKWGQVPVIVKRKDAWETGKSETCTCQEEPSTSYQESSGQYLSRDLSPEPGAPLQRRGWGNNLHCIVDAINLIENS